MSSNFVGNVVEDVVSDLASEAIIGLFKGSIKIIGSAFASPKSPEAPAGPPRDADEESLLREFAALEELEELRQARVDQLCREAGACADDFLLCLYEGDHNRACRWCEPGLFGDDERRAALLHTLSRPAPREWESRFYHLPTDRSDGDLPWIGVDYDVFLVSGRLQPRVLKVWLVRVNDGWAVWNLEWSRHRAG
jgi:hypothetical protein